MRWQDRTNGCAIEKTSAHETSVGARILKIRVAQFQKDCSGRRTSPFHSFAVARG